MEAVIVTNGLKQVTVLAAIMTNYKAPNIALAKVSGTHMHFDFLIHNVDTTPNGTNALTHNIDITTNGVNVSQQSARYAKDTYRIRNHISDGTGSGFDFNKAANFAIGRFFWDFG